jgi:hypothetical protein
MSHDLYAYFVIEPLSASTVDSMIAVDYSNLEYIVYGSQLIQFLSLNWNSRDLIHERLTFVLVYHTHYTTQVSVYMYILFYILRIVDLG